MFFAKIVFAAFTITNYVFVAAQNDNVEGATEPQDQRHERPNEERTAIPHDSHTFVALIDIVFTDGRKRTCTGTIIHDNVVITAAHCFIIPHNTYIEVELTTSFVVIGTRKMYETGYENYLPIERVVTHPKYKGWTADLALVYTFAGMTSDKPGNIIPLVGESTLTPVDSNVTVLSWGHCKDDVVASSHTRAPSATAKPKDKTAEDNNSDSCENTSPTALRVGSTSEERTNSEPDPFPHRYGRQRPDSGEVKESEFKRGNHYPGKPSKQPRFEGSKVTHSYKPTLESEEEFTTVFVSRYLTSTETREAQAKEREHIRTYYTPKHRYRKAHRNITDNRKMVVLMMGDEERNLLNQNFDHTQKYFSINLPDEGKTPVRTFRSFDGDDRKREEKLREEIENRVKLLSKGNSTEDIKIPKSKNKTKNDIKNNVRSWRRQIGKKLNQLTVEIFGFVNVQTCKKLVDKALPAIYSINTNYVVCYAAEEHYISDEDSGAPAIRQGHLVAVTLGGVECEGDHVAIGIKMSCFCPWIAENLPDGGERMKCCKNCCSGNHKDDDMYNRQRNKYLYK